MSPTLKRHLAAIRTGAIEKTNVIGLRKAINAAERLRNGWSPNRSSATVADANELEAAIDKHYPYVKGELFNTGLKLLRSPRYRKRLENVQSVVDDIRAFALIRFDRIGRHGEHAVPVYRAISTNGDTFDFRNIPWQSALSYGEESGPVILRKEIR